MQAELVKSENADLRQFYASRAGRPLWTANGTITSAAAEVVQLVNSADIDDIEPDEIHAQELNLAVERAKAERTTESLEHAEFALSRSFADYVRLTRGRSRGEMLYEHVSLQPQVPSAARALQEAAEARSLRDYVRQMGWLNPLYAPLRRAFLAGEEQDAATRRVVITNLRRLRELPAVPPGGRYVLVNVAAARLWMYEGDHPVDSMKVVVGKVDHQTPMMAGYIRYAILNPYWNVPADFSRDKISKAVLAKGFSYLRKSGYQVLSDWTPDASVVDPASVDWHAVADGAVNLRVRQLPGAANSMGKVKFEFPNQLGIYLHDTPQRELMLEEARQFSSGCVRLEDAQRLGRWLFHGSMPAAQQTEQRIDLPDLVPVYITYITAQPHDDGHVALVGDPYRRDPNSAQALARPRVGPLASR